MQSENCWHCAGGANPQTGTNVDKYCTYSTAVGELWPACWGNSHKCRQILYCTGKVALQTVTNRDKYCTYSTAVGELWAACWGNSHKCRQILYCTRKVALQTVTNRDKYCTVPIVMQSENCWPSAGGADKVASQTSHK
jgi:hypothetical protein